MINAVDHVHQVIIVHLAVPRLNNSHVLISRPHYLEQHQQVTVSVVQDSRVQEVRALHVILIPIKTVQDQEHVYHAQRVHNQLQVPQHVHVHLAMVFKVILLHVNHVD